MKKNIIGGIIFGLCLGAAAWIWHGEVAARRGPINFTDAGDGEPFAHKIERFRAGAREAALVATTNRIVGLRQIIGVDLATGGNNYKAWSAQVTADYFNQIGGVDRTNLTLKFGQWSGRIQCY